jgi:hypothetical protein
MKFFITQPDELDAGLYGSTIEIEVKTGDNDKELIKCFKNPEYQKVIKEVISTLAEMCGTEGRFSHEYDVIDNQLLELDLEKNCLISEEEEMLKEEYQERLEELNKEIITLSKKKKYYMDIKSEE